MRAAKAQGATVDGYIKGFPHDVQVLLKSLRQAIRQAAPHAEEGISYKIPAYKDRGVVVYFAAWKNHIALYPLTAGVKRTFQKELSRYEMSKGTLRFPLDEPLPLPLIRKIVRFRLEENLKRRQQKV